VETIGPYQLKRSLGRGGTGTVFEAQDASGRLVALKAFTHPACDNPVLRERLLNDARAAGAIAHPNLAAVVEVGEHQGRPFVVTEIVPGVDLARAIRSALPLPMEWTLDVLRQITLGLAEAHRRGLLHLDLKPSDVRVTAEGDVKLLDFGVSHLKAIDPAGSAGSLHGIHYRAPELIEGRRPDARADVFSVGALAFELATRRRAFPGDDPTAVMLRITRGALDLSTLPPTVFSPRFEEVVAKGLQRDLGARYPTIEAMHDDLVNLVRDLAPRLLATTDAAREEPEAPLEIRLEDEPVDGKVDSGARDALWREVQQARQEGRLPKALDACRRLLSLDPAHADARDAARDLETAIQDGEVEQLCGVALTYVADGELGLAKKIADKIRGMAPDNPRSERLSAYLEEESGRRAAVALLASARDQLALGHFDEARALAEDALLADPRSAPAREIVDRLSSFIDKPKSEPGGL
jgi:hypothetical protein